MATLDELLASLNGSRYNGFDTATIQAVWLKGKIGPNQDPTGRTWRYDSYGAWMKRDEYGNRNSKYGWEVDHIVPKSRGGTDNLSNLQPLQWESNVKKGDG